jgi:excisionase family DNA binding protein
MSDRFLTPEDAAKRLSISPKTLRDWFRAGKIRGVKAGRLWRIRESDLEAYMADPQGNGRK